MENARRTAQEGAVRGLGEKSDQVRRRGGTDKKDVLDVEAPFSAAPYSLFLSPLFVWFCLPAVDRRQRVSAASAASVRQMGRVGGPGRGRAPSPGPRRGPLPGPATCVHRPPGCPRLRAGLHLGPGGGSASSGPAAAPGEPMPSSFSRCWRARVPRRWVTEERRRKKPKKSN